MRNKTKLIFRYLILAIQLNLPLALFEAADPAEPEDFLLVPEPPALGFRPRFFGVGLSTMVSPVSSSFLV